MQCDDRAAAGIRYMRLRLAPKVCRVDRLTLKLQVVEQLAFVPIKVLDHLKKLPAECKCFAGSPRSSDLPCSQIILSGLINHL